MKNIDKYGYSWHKPHYVSDHIARTVTVDPVRKDLGRFVVSVCLSTIGPKMFVPLTSQTSNVHGCPSLAVRSVGVHGFVTWDASPKITTTSRLI